MDGQGISENVWMSCTNKQQLVLDKFFLQDDVQDEKIGFPVGVNKYGFYLWCAGILRRNQNFS